MDVRNSGLPATTPGVSLDPDHQGRIYASMNEEALYQSKDLGNTWRKDGLRDHH